jgi:biotin transport system substrate-specific component
VLAQGSRDNSLILAPASVVWQVGLALAGSALIALAAQVAVPLPFSPVPVTAQTFAVLLVAGTLGARLGAVSVALYVLEGLVGIPVFAGGASGIARLAGPTGGYLVGFVAAALVVGALVERGWGRRVWTCALAMLAGEVVIYAFGLAWLARFPLPVGLLEAGLFPFLAGDAYKLVAAALALPVGWRIRGFAHRRSPDP